MIMPWTIEYYSEEVRLEIDALPVGIGCIRSLWLEVSHGFELYLTTNSYG